MSKKIAFCVFVILNLTNGQAQSIFYDSISHDTCKVIVVKSENYCQCFDPFNKITKAGFLKDGKRDSKWKIYHNGLLLAEGKYQNDKRLGVWKEYYVSGQELFIGRYKDDKREGLWHVYISVFDLRVNNDIGLRKLIEKRIYKEGVLISTIKVE